MKTGFALNQNPRDVHVFSPSVLDQKCGRRGHNPGLNLDLVTMKPGTVAARGSGSCPLQFVCSCLIHQQPYKQELKIYLFIRWFNTNNMHAYIC